MKSIEEKAKAYDELKVKAQELTEDGYIDKLALLDLFPELKESIDERIKKVIKQVLSESTTEKDECYLDNGVTQQEVFAWLEAQSEQKSTLPKWKYKKDHTSLLKDSLILNKYGCGGKSPSGAIVSDAWVLDYDELAKLPKEELEKQGEKKPAAWSKEDERLCQCIIEDQEEALDKISNDKYGHSEIISDLEEMYRERIAFLKSLKERYTWKPSDEQIDALEDAIRYGKEENIGILSLLYNDLKKLRED